MSINDRGKPTTALRPRTATCAPRRGTEYASSRARHARGVEGKRVDASGAGSRVESGRIDAEVDAGDDDDADDDAGVRRGAARAPESGFTAGPKLTRPLPVASAKLTPPRASAAASADAAADAGGTSAAAAAGTEEEEEDEGRNPNEGCLLKCSASSNDAWLA
jgi:hypothetical protein